MWLDPKVYVIELLLDLKFFIITNLIVMWYLPSMTDNSDHDSSNMEVDCPSPYHQHKFAGSNSVLASN
jgi:hypothetical protein